MARDLFDAINAALTEEQITLALKEVWRAHLAGMLTDDEASFLDVCARRRRPGRPTAATQAIGKINGRICGRFVSRQPQRSPDRQKSRERRRTLGGSSAMPPALRAHYTEGHRAVLCIVAEEAKRRGACEFAIDKIAAMAGVCRTTVQNALHEARRLGHVAISERPRPGLKNLTNVVKIVSREWLRWIGRGLEALGRIGSKTLKTVNPTGKESHLQGSTERTDRPRGAWERTKKDRQPSTPTGKKETTRGAIHCTLDGFGG